MTYEEFLQKKTEIAKLQGHGIDAGTDADIHPLLKPHQRAIVKWMVEGGRRACFAAFGLGKTLIQLEAVRITRQLAGGKGLIIMPLGVCGSGMTLAAIALALFLLWCWCLCRAAAKRVPENKRERREE